MGFDRSSLLLAHLLSSLSPSHLLLAPLPALLASFLPGSRASLHYASGSLARLPYIVPFYISFGGPSGPVGNSGRSRAPFEPETTGCPRAIRLLEGQCYILAKPPAHLAFFCIRQWSIKPWLMRVPRNQSHSRLLVFLSSSISYEPDDGLAWPMWRLSS